MAFENFRLRAQSRLAGFNVSDDDIRAAVRAVKARGLLATDEYVVAQIKLAYMGRIMRGEKR